MCILLSKEDIDVTNCDLGGMGVDHKITLLFLGVGRPFFVPQFETMDTCFGIRDIPRHAVSWHYIGVSIMENQTKGRAPKSAKVVSEVSENPKALMLKERDKFLDAEMKNHEAREELVKREYGARRTFSVSVNVAFPKEEGVPHWYAKKLPAGSTLKKEINALRKSIVDYLEEQGHSNPNQVWKMIRLYGEEEREGKKRTDKGTGVENRTDVQRFPDEIYKLLDFADSDVEHKKDASACASELADVIVKYGYADPRAEGFMTTAQKKRANS